jgi:hypothetical protein
MTNHGRVELLAGQYKSAQQRRPASNSKIAPGNRGGFFLVCPLQHVIFAGNHSE